MNGKRAPSLARAQLRGWGMSELERVVRSLNSYMKNQDMIFELIDEAKINIFGINDFSNKLSSENGTQLILKAIQLANQAKSYQSALVMDKEDEYSQKQINFSGLSDIHQQNKVGIAGDLRQPMTKIFGQSAAGFNAGEDDIENYNATIESEIRGKADGMIIQSSKLICQKLFGYIPNDLEIEYQSLRVLSAEQEQGVKTSQINNLLALYDRKLITSQQLVEEVNKKKIFAIKVDEASECFPLLDEFSLLTQNKNQND
jgi:phage-related protein (TIGR01555 family)